MTDKLLIAVWGNPNSGKTVTAVKLAQAFAARRKNVLLLCCDALCPSVSTIAPQAVSKHSSLGELLSLPVLTQEELLRYTLPLNTSPRIALLGYKKGDNVFSYASYDRDRAVDLLTLARHLADVVLVDCASYLSADPLSAVALEVADAVVRLHSCDLKSLMFYASYMPLIGDARFRRPTLVSVLSNVKVEQDSREYIQVFSNIQVTLPHLSMLEQQAASARLLDELSGKEALDYNTSIQQIMRLLSSQNQQKPSKPAPSSIVLPFGKIAGVLQRIWSKRGEDK
ncbi:MinD/ParA family ATP-binding protein [Paenibacillus ehimensis]|uniref:MinD/ParA family ATP-binding protein n=1 Tax=Paenibacillus ehimensis TaxID=79264 RepID=UPI000472EDCF|nr:hypothetical protein [Paenibacillus ehimensis]